jgi:hypothetical protein
MRTRFVNLALASGLLTATALARQSHTTEVNHRSNPALEQFKSLAGEWEGTDSRGNLVHASYEWLSTGVVMERLEPAGKASMITMYSLDGDHILAIHFCSEGNQPIMKTGPISTANGKYDFVIERAYGLSSPDDLHMVELVVTLTDNDHFTQAWTNVHHGKRSTNTITLARKK